MFRQVDNSQFPFDPPIIQPMDLLILQCPYSCIIPLLSLLNCFSSCFRRNFSHREKLVLSSRGFFGGRAAAFDDDDDDDNQPSLAPVDLIAFAWMMQRPGVAALPTAIHIQFGVSFPYGLVDSISVFLSGSIRSIWPRWTAIGWSIRKRYWTYTNNDLSKIQ